MKFSIREAISRFGKRGALTSVVGRSLDKGIRLYKMGGGWGDIISPSDWPKSFAERDRLKVYGFKNPKPRKHDILLIPMQSGKTVLAKFVSVRPCNDILILWPLRNIYMPPDMFFADIEIVDYVENLSEEAQQMLGNATEGPI
jgi:hypothetical protein